MSFINKSSKSIVNALGATFLLCCATSASANMPIYAAYVSDDLQQECKVKSCELDILDAKSLSDFAHSLDNSQDIADSLALSEYEVLIGNAIVASTATTNSELVLEITTSWREVPIDDLILRTTLIDNDINQAAITLLTQWANHLESEGVLSAKRIYQVLGASNYDSELQLPEAIGEFTRYESAMYRDPLLGSITRYSHPEYSDAIVDISVYPFSPFAFQQQAGEIKTDDYLQLEMQNEVAQISQLIQQANIADYQISNIQTAKIEINGTVLNGLRLEVLLNSSEDPIYSTQFVFQQNDKIIKLTGNLPGFMMSKLVAESVPQIKVPAESPFMRGLRQG